MVTCVILAGDLIRSRRALAVLQSKIRLAARELTDLRSKDLLSQKELVELRSKDTLLQIKIATLQAQADSYSRTGAVRTDNCAKCFDFAQIRKSNYRSMRPEQFPSALSP